MSFQCYSIMSYLPVRYPANEDDWRNRRCVWNFKDGICTPFVLDGLVAAINYITNGKDKSEYVICFIPASTKAKTKIRYGNLTTKLWRKTGVMPKLSAIEKSCDSEASHISGKSSNPTKDFEFDTDCFKGKKVILIDDVLTTGRTFKDTATKMMNLGALSVNGVFVAKTINPDYTSNTINYGSVQQKSAIFAY